MVFIGLPPVAPASLQSLLYRRLRYADNGFSLLGAVPGGAAGGAAAIAVAGGLLLGIRLRFHHHAPQQLPSGLAFLQQAADELGCNLLSGSGEEGWGERWEDLGGY